MYGCCAISAVESTDVGKTNRTGWNHLAQKVKPFTVVQAIRPDLVYFVYWCLYLQRQFFLVVRHHQIPHCNMRCSPLQSSKESLGKDMMP